MDPQHSSTWALLDGEVAAAVTYQREEMIENELSTWQAEISASWDINQEELRQFLNALSTVLNALPAHSKDGERFVELKKEGSGLPWWCRGWESTCQCRRHGFDPWSGKIPHAAEQLSPVCHTHWAHMLQLLKPMCLEPELCNERSHCNEKPEHCSE